MDETMDRVGTIEISQNTFENMANNIAPCESGLSGVLILFLSFVGIILFNILLTWISYKLFPIKSLKAKILRFLIVYLSSSGLFSIISEFVTDNFYLTILAHSYYLPYLMYRIYFYPSCI